MLGTGWPTSKRRVPGGEQVQIVLVEVGDRLGVVEGELLVGQVVDPCAHDLTDELPAGLAADGVRDHSDGVVGLDEAERHGQDFRPRGGRYFCLGASAPHELVHARLHGRSAAAGGAKSGF